MSSVMSSSIQEAFSLVLEPLEAVKESLLAIVPPDSMVLAETVQHSLSGGGKYLRPVITLLSGSAVCSETNPEERQARAHAMIEVAAVTEMIHVATLLHDDVIDGSELRRGKKTVRAHWGNKISVLSGDFLLAQASVKLSKLGNTRLVSIFAHVLADLCDGEVEQLHTSFTLNDSGWDSYYRKSICKTASLFSAGCEAAGVVHGLPEDRIQALRTYGRNFGIAFQIVDDLLDYTATEAEMGKPVLDDLRNGLTNAPILLALESDRLSDTERQELRDAVELLFEQSRQEQPTDATVSRIQDFLARAEALEETRRLATQYIEEAREAIAFVADGPEKRALLSLVDYITERRN